MTQDKTLLRGAQIVTVDPEIGTLATGDILIEGDRITAVGAHVDAPDADVVDVSGHVIAPGMVDTHRHTWQSLGRAVCADWSLADYFYGIRLALSPAYSAEDVYLGNKVGALEALNAGVTTILDFSHCNNTPEHSDAAVRGLLDAGIRATFCYGFFESSPYAPPHFVDHASRLADFERIADTYFASIGLVSLGVALTELGLVPFSDTRAEIEVARARGALIATHMGCVWSMPSGLAELDAAGLLGPDQVHIHCNTLNDDEWRALARAGAKVSISVETELNMGMGRPAFEKCLQFGVKPTLSCDVVSLSSGDLVTQARMGLGFKRWADTEALNLAGKDVETVSTTALDALTWATVNGADALGMAESLGSITPGKQADLMIIGGDSFTQTPQIDAVGTLVFQMTPHDVRHVLVAGRFVKRDGVLVDHDMADLLAQAHQASEQILARVHTAVPVLPGTPGGGFADVTAAAIANLERS